MKTILKYILVLSIAFLSVRSYSQKQNIDSLVRLAQSSNNDSIKIYNYYKATSLYIESGNLVKADSIIEILLNFKNSKFKDIAALCYSSNKGYIFELNGQFTKALDYYFEGIKIAEKEKNLEFQSSLYNNIGIIYFSQNDLDKALNYYLKAINFANASKSKKGIGNYFNNVGNIYYSKKDYKNALNYYKESLEIRKNKRDERGEANSYNNIGSVYLQTNEIDEALKYFENALKIQIKLDDKLGIAYSYLNISNVYQKKTNYLKAEENVLKALSISKEINFPDALRDSYHALADLYENKKEFEKSILYYKLFVSFRDSLRNEQQLKEINQKEMNNELFRKEVLLKAENEKQKLEHNEKQKRNRILIFSTLFVLFLMVVFAISIYNRYKLTQHQKKVIEEKQKEILDSIRYAKRIQQTMLPSEKFIDSKLKKNK